MNQSAALYPWGDNEPFYSFSAMMKKKYGRRVQKISVDAGFTCPNRDGTKGVGGCTFCINDAFNPSYCTPTKTVRQQLEEGMEFHRKRYRRAEDYLAYFQAYSNTYKPIEELDKLYHEALNVPGVSGLAIGTRPDCVDTELIDYLANLSKSEIILLELGVESIYDQTLLRINRGHDFGTSISAIQMAATAGLHVGIHLIFGLPGETKEMMIESAAIISGLPVSSVKFHQLQIIRNTVMEKEFLLNPDIFLQFTLEEYIEFIISYTERINPSIAIERFAGEVPPAFLHKAPWSRLRYDQLLNLIRNEMKSRNTRQGVLCDLNQFSN